MSGEAPLTKRKNMITRTAQDRFHIYNPGGNIDMHLSPDAVLDRLRANGVWSEDQLTVLMNYDIGQSTPAPFSVYR